VNFPTSGRKPLSAACGPPVGNGLTRASLPHLPAAARTAGVAGAENARRPQSRQTPGAPAAHVRRTARSPTGRLGPPRLASLRGMRATVTPTAASRGSRRLSLLQFELPALSNCSVPPRPFRLYGDPPPPASPRPFRLYGGPPLSIPRCRGPPAGAFRVTCSAVGRHWK
jgi:hypothetical protein